MNLPNKLTLSRIFLIPVFVVIPYIDAFMKDVSLFNHSVMLGNLIIVIIFAIASITDFVDGYVARKYNLVTTFGKFMDPLADKLLVTAALLMLVELGLLPAWVPIAILSREFMVTGIRLLAISEGKVIAASKLGKLKTVSQMIMILVLFIVDTPYKDLINKPLSPAINSVNIILILLATSLTVISGVDYFVKNKDIILESK
ncbi:CDP-diacylglycerol--glycerol-3-phosphate 3-phosphatidyltransferase [Haloplasma contractile]|uniref:CDP-diacylglycerol--glycerol-3-phosphate 3-phosphatidyltransferase n=1 Tax=Haloplasma contractile SSD-17B TaxID=1033810 RepID=U2EG53_9MOLU|nr:CDP-diacylglycerol--glycerol-3-phosphate 3-phosphatidyltransferase [Haloplasma contractile]ERJ13596.1 CDP-diacylglycerol--glycerol-3-phosphate 3-phosphatidyltransferase protein [Haloplasma contractile SSD-17B]